MEILLSNGTYKKRELTGFWKKMYYRPLFQVNIKGSNSMIVYAFITCSYPFQIKGNNWCCKWSVLKSLHLIHCNSITQGKTIYILLEIKHNLMNYLSGVGTIYMCTYTSMNSQENIILELQSSEILFQSTAKWLLPIHVDGVFLWF